MGGGDVTRSPPLSCSVAAILGEAVGKRTWEEDLAIGAKPLLPKDSLGECGALFPDSDILGNANPLLSRCYVTML